MRIFVGAKRLKNDYLMTKEKTSATKGTAPSHDINGISVDVKSLPKSFYYCFCAGCPRAQECLRFRLGELLPADATCGKSVFPQSYQLHDTCPHYRSAEPVTLAWGCADMFADVLERHAHELRMRLYKCVGSKTSYSRYEKGEYKLTPKMQQDVLQIFADMGYDISNRRFKHYEKTLDFTETSKVDMLKIQKDN